MGNDPEELGYTHGRHAQARHDEERRNAHDARRRAKKPNQCKYCKAPMYWATSSSTGSIMTIDAEPNPDGNILLDLVKVGGRDTLIATVLGPRSPRPEGRRIWMSHHATCPNKPG